MAHAIRLVFSSPRYSVLASAIFVSMLLGLLILSEFVFLAPYVVAHLPGGGELGLALIVALSALSALVIPMNVFRVVMFRSPKQRVGGGIFGSVVGAVAGACSCGSVGFAVISTFGSVGATATAFLTNYEVPIRAVAVAALAATYFATARSLKTECGA